MLWSASLPSALTGADLAIFAAAFSYLADVTTVEDRTMRVTILDIAYLSTMPTGVALGKRELSSLTWTVHQTYHYSHYQSTSYIC